MFAKAVRYLLGYHTLVRSSTRDVWQHIPEQSIPQLSCQSIANVTAKLVAIVPGHESLEQEIGPGSPFSTLFEGFGCLLAVWSHEFAGFDHEPQKEQSIGIPSPSRLVKVVVCQ